MIATLALLSITAGPLDQANVEERLGAQIPQDLLLTDHLGRTARMSELSRGKPLVLALAYYRCPMLCSLVLNGVASTLKKIEPRAGRDFEVITVSFDASEGPREAAERRDAVLPALGGVEKSGGWPFFVADERDVKRLLDATGVSVAKDPSTGQWAHPAVFLVLTPDGRVSRYFYGFETRPFDLELALAEAGRGESGPSFAKLLLRCFSYDPAKRRYAFAIETAFRAGGVVLFLVVGCSVGLLFHRERKRRTA